jgi:adenylate cyclase
VLVSAEFVAAAEDCGRRLESLGRHALRGVRQTKEIFALALGERANESPAKRSVLEL